MPSRWSAVAGRLWTDPYKRRWLGFIALSTAFFLVSFHRLSTAVLSEELMRSFDTTGSQLGFLHSSFFYLYAAIQLPAGVITDSIGARRTAFYGTIVMSTGGVIFAIGNSYLVAFGGRAMVGLGGGVLFVSILRFCANWYRPDEFATMTGVTLTVGALGGIVAATPLALLVAQLGWRLSMLAIAVVGFGAAGLIYVTSHNRPENAGLEPVEGASTSVTQSLSDLREHTKRAFTEIETWLLAILMFCSAGASITVFGLWGVPFISQMYDVSITYASVFVMLGSVGGLVGPPLFGWLSDRWGRRTELIVVSMAVFSLAWAIIAILGTPALLIVGGVFLFSRVLGGGTALTYAVIRERFPDEASGTVTGIVNITPWLGSAVFPVILGWVLDAYWTGEEVAGARVYSETGYRVGFGLLAVALGISLVCAVWLHFRTRSLTARTETEPEAADV